MLPVENEDQASALLRFKNGAHGVIETSRINITDQIVRHVDDMRRQIAKRAETGQRFLAVPVENPGRLQLHEKPHQSAGTGDYCAR
jgi:hypothetical protein